MSYRHCFITLIGILTVGMAVSFAQGGTPIPIAHRGLLRHAPENTLPAFAACLELGLGFELDIRTTKDGYLVVLHDDNVERTTNGPSLSVRDMTLAEVKQLDAGSWFDESYAGVRVPTLEETLAMVKQRKRGSTMIALNVKHLTRKGESQLVSLVEKYHLLNESFAFDQSEDMSRRLKQLNPGFRIGQNVNPRIINERMEEGLLDCYLLTSLPTPEVVSQLHVDGRQVFFNFAGTGEARRNPETWKRAAATGIDGLLTDFPLECRATWREVKSSAAECQKLNTTEFWVETPWGKPVIDRGVEGSWEHFAVDNPYVHVEDGKLFCFYEAQDRSFTDGGREAIGIATSNDGIHWKKLSSNPVLTTGNDGSWDDIVAKLPAGVIERDGLYHLFYSGRDSHTKQIGLATSHNLTGPWTKYTQNPILKGRSGMWDTVLSTHPAPVFERNGRYYLLFRGMEKRYEQQGVGLAVSTDLRHWQHLSEEPIILPNEEIASLAVTRSNEHYIGISQPLGKRQRRYWFSVDLKKWQKGPPANFRASIQVETISNPFCFNGRWTILYEQKDRIYRAELHPAVAP